MSCLKSCFNPDDSNFGNDDCPNCEDNDSYRHPESIRTESPDNEITVEDDNA